MIWEVWLQGGEANDFRSTWIGGAPPDRLYLIGSPGSEYWIVIPDDGWPGALCYERVPGVEQFDHERIYYPCSDGELRI